MGTIALSGERTGGVFGYDQATGDFSQMDLGDTLNEMASVMHIIEDRLDPEILWLTTSVGLCQLNKVNLKRKWFMPKTDNPWLRDDRTYYAIQAPDNKIWLHLENFFSGKLGYFDSVGKILLCPGHFLSYANRAKRNQDQGNGPGKR